MLLLLETNFLHLILPVAFLLVRVGWPPPLPRTHPFHRGEGGWWVMTMTMAGGVGGGPGTWNIYTWKTINTCVNIWSYIYICMQIIYILYIIYSTFMHMQVCLHRHAPSFVLVNTYITIITSYNNRHSIKRWWFLCASWWNIMEHQL